MVYAVMVYSFQHIADASFSMHMYAPIIQV